jgi:hypothetical protein
LPIALLYSIGDNINAVQAASSSGSLVLPEKGQRKGKYDFAGEGYHYAMRVTS